MKICAYVQNAYAKTNYKNECMDTRQFVGLRVIIDCLERAGYTVDYAGISSVHKYDVVLVSLTSDCDWWTYIAERIKWKEGNYKVLIGGAGVLHVTPFLRWFDAAMFGRGEDLIVPLVIGIEQGDRFHDDSVMWSDEFSYKKTWTIKQTNNRYPHSVRLNDKREYQEDAIGCNHKCLFCGYTWHRRFVSDNDYYAIGKGLFAGMEYKERALLDMASNMDQIDFRHLRTTAIDGFSERIRCGVNKKISKQMLLDFLVAMLKSDVSPHQIKLFNICGYPSETEDDWFEFLETLEEADLLTKKREKQWSVVLHSTPFRPMPGTPMACAPMSKRNFRGLIGKTLGPKLKGNLIYQGDSLWAVESMGTDGLSTVMLSAIAHRGNEADSENIARLCATSKFWRASGAAKEATLEKYFDMDAMFGAYTPETLPSRYMRSYAQVEKMWGRTPLEVAARG